MDCYKYFININWFPINEPKTKRYNCIYCPIRRPEIISTVAGFNNIFEINDPFLFYCDESGEYEYMVYKFDNLRVVKFRRVNDNAFKFCIKSTDLNIGFLKNLVPYKNSIALNIKVFNPYKFYEIDNPIFVEHIDKYEHCCDIAVDNGKLLLSLGETNSFISIGHSSINVKAKACVQFSNNSINISIFDIYLIDDKILNSKFTDRHKQLSNAVILFKLNDNIILSIAEIINLTQLSNCVNLTHLLIVDNDEIFYMNWLFNPCIYAKINNSSIVLADGVIENFFKHSDDVKLNNQIVKINVINHEYEPAYDRLTIDKFTLYKTFQNKDHLDIEFLKKTNEKYLQNLNKQNLIKKYTAGKTLIVSDYIGKIHDIEYTEVKSLPADDNELKVLLSKYHTVVIDGKNHYNQKIESFGNKLLLLSGAFDFKDAGQKTFVFLLGCIGSGKSALVKKVRESLNMSGGIFVAQIDKLVEKNIEYIINPSEETYFKLRNSFYNNHMDDLMGQAILNSESIILETTNVNNKYVEWLKNYHYRIVIVLVNESYENILQNISTRNITKLRKTSLTIEKYEEFQKNISTYTKNADQVIDILKYEVVV
jgi:hypothetical protein